jgi:hypothetical protein
MRLSLFIAFPVMACACGRTSETLPNRLGTNNVHTDAGGEHTSDGGARGTGGTSASTPDAGADKSCAAPCGVKGPPAGEAFHRCCDGTCRDIGNDPDNCGECGQRCAGAKPYCHFGKCEPTPCDTSCDAGSCCGAQCCGAGETCCDLGGPFGPMPRCTTLADGGTCPFACYDCMCASPSTPIATPSGERPIAELAVGDLVYSVDHDAIIAVPIARVNRSAVPATHHVLRVTLAGGRVLEVSGGHPLAAQGTFNDLEPGSTLDATRVLDVQSVCYGYDVTYDILPASDTGTYFAAGIRIGSTLAAQR